MSKIVYLKVNNANYDPTGNSGNAATIKNGQIVRVRSLNRQAEGVAMKAIIEAGANYFIVWFGRDGVIRMPGIDGITFTKVKTRKMFVNAFELYMNKHGFKGKASRSWARCNAATMFHSNGELMSDLDDLIIEHGASQHGVNDLVREEMSYWI